MSQGSVRSGLNDYYHFGDWSIEAYHKAHRSDRAWLDRDIELISRFDPGRKVGVLTHYRPLASDEVVHPLHEGSKISSILMIDLSSEE